MPKLLPTTIPATEKRLAGVQGAARSPLAAGTDAAKSRQDVRRVGKAPRHPTQAGAFTRSPPASWWLLSPGSAAGQPCEAEADDLASAGFSCQTVPRFNSAHITRTR